MLKLNFLIFIIVIFILSSSECKRVIVYKSSAHLEQAQFDSSTGLVVPLQYENDYKMAYTIPLTLFKIGTNGNPEKIATHPVQLHAGYGFTYLLSSRCRNSRTNFTKCVQDNKREIDVFPGENVDQTFARDGSFGTYAQSMFIPGPAIPSLTTSVSRYHYGAVYGFMGDLEFKTSLGVFGIGKKLLKRRGDSGMENRDFMSYLTTIQAIQFNSYLIEDRDPTNMNIIFGIDPEQNTYCQKLFDAPFTSTEMGPQLDIEEVRVGDVVLANVTRNVAIPHLTFFPAIECGSIPPCAYRQLNDLYGFPNNCSNVVSKDLLLKFAGNYLTIPTRSMIKNYRTENCKPAYDKTPSPTIWSMGHCLKDQYCMVYNMEEERVTFGTWIHN